MNIILLHFLLLLPFTHASCGDFTCRSPTCCAEMDCLHNPLDPDFANAISCPCMISQSSRCVAPGATIILECDPGGVCQDHCDWKTPGGACHWDDNSSTCTDSSIRFLNKNGACNVELTDAESRHTGVWRCKSVVSGTFSDYVNITVSANCGSASAGATWWKTGWTAPVFWTSLVGGIIFIIIIVVLLFFFCCPWLCLCFPCCAKRDERLEDRPSRSGRQENKQRRRSDQRRSSHSPVVLVNNSEVYEQVTGYSSGEGGTGREHQTEESYEQRYRSGNQDYEDLDFDSRQPNNTLDYDVPRHYSQGGENMRTAKKKSNLVTKELEERIRKASGVARQDQIGVVQG